MDRRTFVQQTALAGLAAAATGVRAAETKPEWRNRQSGMSYRQLGRTGLMVSEFVSGGDPIRTANYEHLNLALEMGLNYLDMAPGYGNGNCEEAYGKLLGGSARREKVFLATKVSGFTNIRNRLYKEIFDGLPADRQAAIQKRAAELVRERRVDKPGYFVDYYPGQRNQIGPAYLSNAMAKDYGHKVEGGKQFREFILTSIAGSLKRVGTDYFDILLCPHGACTPEELEIPEILETFREMKKQGKVRFLGVSSHTGPAEVLSKAASLGHFDMAMAAYNIVNAGYMERSIQEAAAAGMGFVAMKVAMAVATHHKSLQPVPQWRIDKVNRIIPGEMKPPMKAYLFALQNPNITAINSNLWDTTFIKENLSLAGQKVEMQPS